MPSLKQPSAQAAAFFAAAPHRLLFGGDWVDGRARIDGYSFGLDYVRERSASVLIMANGWIKAVLLMTFMARVIATTRWWTSMSRG